MSDMIRSSASDITNTMAKVKNMTEQLASLNTELAKWKIYVATSVVPSISDGLELRISIAKSNGSGFIYTVSPASAARFVDDPETLVQQIVGEVFERLFKEEIRNVLTHHVMRGLENATAKNKV